MRKAFIALLIICMTYSLAFGGATTVYPVADPSTFSGSSDGISLLAVNGLAGTGDTTIVTVAAGETPRLMRLDFKPDADVTGTIDILIGSTVVYSINNALADNVYGENLLPNFFEGALGDDLIINTATSVGIRYNAAYRKD